MGRPLPTTDPAVTEPARPHYRPHLDGLRFVAVYLVVAFHAGLSGFAGGFIGVDVFFVLSGYLVTGILLRDLVSSRRIDFRRFYARRFRRILPAAAVTLIVVAIVYSRVVSPSEMQDAVGGFKAAFLFIANWFFLRQSVDYFATSVDRSPVLHFWSLAVEEQFYLVWPLLFGAVFVATARLGRLRWWILRALVAAAALASLFAALHLAKAHLDRAYYGTDTRAYQLLAGAFLALTPQLMRLPRRLGPLVRVVVPLALGALVYVATSLVHVGPITRGVAAVLLTTALIVGLENWRTGPVARALAAPPVAYLGRVSFATYLWHWPVVIIATHERHIAPVPLFALTTVVSTLLAIVSYHLLEHPVRASALLDRYRMHVIAAGLAISLVGALAVLPAIARLDSGSTAAAIDPSGAGGVLDWRAAKKDIPPLPSCVGKPLSGCILVSGSGERLVLAGDSHARMWIPAFEEIAHARSMTLMIAAMPDCPWQRGLNYFLGGPKVRADCRRHQDDLFDRVLPEFAPNIVVLVHQGYDDHVVSRKMIATDGHDISPGQADYEPDLIDASKRSLDAMRAPGRKVVILEPIPMAPLSFDPISCISSGKPLNHCSYRAGVSPTPLESFYRSQANGTTMLSIDVDKLTCPSLPVCDAVVNGLIVKRDPSHLTGTYSRSLAPQLTTLLAKRDVFSSS